ncbi:MAG: hypothetical protein ACJ8D9_17885 [Xanthobacteraceae bacterium]
MRDRGFVVRWCRIGHRCRAGGCIAPGGLASAPENLLLDLNEFTVRPMDRAMNNVRQKNLVAIDPVTEAE